MRSWRRERPVELPMTSDEMGKKVANYKALRKIIDETSEEVDLPDVDRRMIRNIADRSFRKAFEKYIQSYL